MRILFRADAGSRIGSGHVMRCLALAQVCIDDGGEVWFARAECPAALDRRLAAEGLSLLNIDDAAGSANDAKRTNAAATKQAADWIVVDGYQFDETYLAALKAAGHRVLLFNDDGALTSYPADLILNQNCGASPALYRNCLPHARLLLGADHVVLRREFLSGIRQERIEPERARKILVTMGGADPENVTIKIIRAIGLLNDPSITPTVVVGMANSHLKTIESSLASLPNAMLLQNATDMRTLMAEADVAISGAGSTSWELCYMGLPSALVILADNQRDIAERLYEANVALNLGWYDKFSVEEAAEKLRALIDDAGRRSRMASLGRKLVDGLGGRRILAEMKKMSA